MSIQKQWIIRLAVLLALALGADIVQAQYSMGTSGLGALPANYGGTMPPGVGPQGAPGYPPGPAIAAYDPATGSYYAPPGALPVVAGPDPLVGGATPPQLEPEMFIGGEGYPNGGEEYYDEGFDGHGGHHERLGLLSFLLPYDEGGVCAPRYWDVFADAVRFRREQVSRTVNFTSDGILGPAVLSTDNLDFNDAYGFRAGVSAQLGPGSNVEFNYLGGLNFHSQAQVTSSTNNLFSTFSDFGSNPFLGFVETDNANYHDIAYSSALQSYEMSFRRRWQGRNCRVQGSWLAGIRTVTLNEDFIHTTRSTSNGRPTSMNYSTNVNNTLTGFQVGGDAWVTLIPGLRFGGELKAGLYGNYTHQTTSIFATSIPNGQFERTGENGAAFVSELSLQMTYRLGYKWTARAGYDFLYVDGVALAPENFNSGPPFVAGQRTLFFNNNGNVFLHGATLGLEYNW